jgi:hypothetical protein
MKITESVASWLGSPTRNCLFLLLLLLLQTPEANAVEKGWLLKQFSTLAGLQEVFLGKDLMKIENKDRRVKAIVDAKRLTILMYSDATKRYFECPLAEYKGPPTANLLQALGMQENEYKVAKVSSGTELGHRASFYKVIERQAEPASKRLVPGDPGYYASKFKGFWTFDDLGATPSLCRTLCRSYGLIAVDKVPCRGEYIQFGRTVKGLYTVSVRRALVSSSTFKAPSGYNRVEHEVELLGDVSASPASTLWKTHQSVDKGL